MFVVFILVFMPSVGFGQIYRLNAAPPKTAQPAYQGILTLWHVDTFEGGTYSRESLLGDFSKSFEKVNKGTYIIVSGFTPEEFVTQLSLGFEPDLISYAIGAGELIADRLSEYGGALNIRDDILSGGKIDGKVFGVPWCMGGYTLLSTDKLLLNAGLNKDDALIDNVFKSGYEKKSGKNTKPIFSVAAGQNGNLPMLALSLNTDAAIADDFSIEGGYCLDTQYKAYEKFVSLDYSTFLLGTQRDVYRCSLKCDQGKINELISVPLSGFSDLVQYISIFGSAKKDKFLACERFIEYITGDDCQRRISALSMFGVNGARLYGGGALADMELALSKPLKTPNAFTSKKIIEDYNLLLKKAIAGDAAAKNSLKNI
jgi:hypothetical protein